MEDMKITMEKKTIGKDEKIDWYVSGTDMDKMLIDRETAIALHWQLMKEKMGIAFREELRSIPEKTWTWEDVKDKMIAEGAIDGRGYSRRV